MTLPKLPMSFPSTLHGQTNGSLPPHLLKKIGVGSALMEITAARSFMAMFAEARSLGFNIKHVGHYRSFKEQLNLFVSRYEPVSFAAYSATPSSRRKKWEDASKYGYGSSYWVKRLVNGRYPATASTPGNSNHGWGLALDIAEEYDSDSAPDPIRNVFVNWLIGNAHRFGISAELDSEPWHWRYVAGDDIPQETLKFEGNFSLPVETHQPKPEGSSLRFDYPGSPLQLGSKGVAVQLVQYVVGATQDGDFGHVTSGRVVAWQTKNGLPATGIVDATTWSKMFG